MLEKHLTWRACTATLTIKEQEGECRPTIECCDLVTTGEDKADVSAAFSSAFTSEVSQGIYIYRQGSRKSIVSSGRGLIQKALEKS